MSKINFFIMCGIPGSGKSTYARKLAGETNSIIICRDSLREMIAGTYDLYQQRVFESPDKKFSKRIENIVSEMATQCLVVALHNNQTVIIDETNITTNRRCWWLTIAKNEMGNSIHSTIIWVKTPIEECIARRTKDPHGCDANWPIIINNMNKVWQDPDIEKEGFDDVRIITK